VTLKDTKLNAPAKRRGDDGATCAPARVSIVEDEEWLREHLACEIGRCPALRCVSSYRTAELALRGVPGDRPDVVIMDINLPGIDGIECVRRLKLDLPQTQFLMLTVYEEDDKIFNSLRAGASGYLPFSKSVRVGAPSLAASREKWCATSTKWAARPR
jgi:DNA-binding NarL/FixJ family response regulator